MLNPQLDLHLDHVQSNDSSDDENDDGVGRQRRRLLSSESETLDETCTNNVTRNEIHRRLALGTLLPVASAFSIGIFLGRQWKARPLGHGWIVPTALSLTMGVGFHRLKSWFRNRAILKRQARLQDFQLTVSSMLGSMGSETCSWPTDLPIICLSTSTPDWESLLVEIEAWLGENMTFLRVVDVTLNRIQTSVSLRLGLGAMSPCVERIERQALSNTSHSNLPLTIPLIKLRRNMYRELGMYRASLREILGEEEDNIDTQPEVVTISSLRHARNEILNLLPIYVGRILRTSTAHKFDVKELTRRVRNSTAYLRAMYLLDEEVPNTPTKELGHELVSLCRKSAFIQDALASMKDLAENDCQSTESAMQADEELRGWWSRIQVLSEDIRGSIERIDQDMFGKTVDSSEGDEEYDKEASLQTRMESGEVKDEFTTDESSDAAPHLVWNEEDTDTKTLVYSGKGTKARKKATPKAQIGIPTPDLPENDPAMDLMLIHELQSRIKELPPVEEVDVICSGDDKEDHGDSQTQSENIHSLASQEVNVEGGRLSAEIAMRNPEPSLVAELQQAMTSITNADFDSAASIQAWEGVAGVETCNELE